MSGKIFFILLGLILLCRPADGRASNRILDFEALGGVAEDSSLDTCWANARLLNQTFAALQHGDTLLIPASKTFWLMGGIYARGLLNVTIQIDGTLKFSDAQEVWPREPSGQVHECFFMEQLDQVTFTSSMPAGKKGVIDGSGLRWWGLVELLLIGENRPRLLSIYNSTNLLVENILLKNSPYWTFLANDIANLEIRHAEVDARRRDIDYHDLSELTAFNTDGFDVAGKNVWIHDCTIWNDDDCIAVKEQSSASFRSSCSENMLFERINASGVGLTIGSIGPSPAHTCVRNITFRDSTMYNTFKGIYMKSRPGAPGATGEITDVLYENILIRNASQWSIWIGPQQASYKEACSLIWPFFPTAPCPVPAGITWNNIVLRNVTVDGPQLSPGVILGNTSNPMLNILFDNVFVREPGFYPWRDRYYACEGVEGTAQGNTQPPPPCFKIK